MKIDIIKRISIVFLITIMLFGMIGVYAATATPKSDNDEIISEEVAGELVKVKENTKKEYQNYVDLYGSEAYGMTAYVLNKVRLYSIPFCFVGIAIGAIFQYVIGVRKLDLRDKGFHLVITFITILVICQILPLIFAIVVRGWRG